MPAFDLLAFDADDTLWHNERLYVNTQARFTQLLSRYHPAEWISERLYLTETRNMAQFGYGIKAFALSMLETAIELTEGRISAPELHQIIGWAKEMINAEVELLTHVGETIPELAKKYPLMLITKGDLLDQERKIGLSGLGEYFQQVEVVSHKTTESYRQLLKKHTLQPERFLMVGNSLRSDILPVLELGGSAVYVPYETTWLHETADLPPAETTGFYQLTDLGELPALLTQLDLKGAREPMETPEKIITLAQLRRNNGDRGTPKWIAHAGIVYDVSECARWRKEMHENLHFPGQDLTSEFPDAPHNEIVFKHPCVKIIGHLQQDG